MVVVDEVHHAAADSYRRILDHFPDAKRLGLTATATRTDGRKLGADWDDVAYEYGLVDAIRDGWLVPIRRTVVRVSDLALDDVQRRGGDFVASDLEDKILRAEHSIHEWALGILDQAGERKTIAFTPGVESSRRLAEILNRYKPGSAQHLDGETDKNDRRVTLAHFAEGRFQYLTNCALFLEGFDEPSTACVAMCRPTQSHTLYVQAVGRGTRLAPGKTDLLVIDFTDASGRFDLVTAVDILGEDDDADVRRDASERCAREPGMAVLDALAAAREAKAMRRAAEEARLREAMGRAGVRATGRVHAFQIDDILRVNRHAAMHRVKRWGAKPLSDKQRAFAERSGLLDGVDLATDEGIGLARARIDKAFARIKAGLCTPKQARVLAKHGLPTDVSMAVARQMLDELAGAGWRMSAQAKAALATRATAHDAIVRSEGSGE
jgi:superfamily II DNA or RNA helicase